MSGAGEGTVPVTVVIGFYGGHDTIERAVRSVLEQRPAPSEVVVVDDGSPEPLGGLLDDIPQVRVVRHTENRGIPAARNTGIGAARQPWIAFLDQDDEWRPGKLARQWRMLDAVPEPERVVVYSRCETVWLDLGRSKTFPGRRSVRRLARGGEAAVRELAGGGNMVPWISVLLHRSVFDRYGPMDEEVRGGSDDYELMLRLAAEGVPLVCADGPAETGVIHYIHGSNFSHQPRLFEDDLRLIDRLAERYPLIRQHRARAWARAYRDLGWFHARNGNRSAARDAYRHATRSRPFWPRLWVDRLRLGLTP